LCGAGALARFLADEIESRSLLVVATTIKASVSTVKTAVPSVASCVMNPSAVSAAMVGLGDLVGINEGLAGDWTDAIGAVSRVSAKGCFVSFPRSHRQS
jgi:hypothetical protein